MTTIEIRLPNVQAVQSFVEAISPLNGDFELLHDGYILDARSLMGIFSLDLSQPLQLRVYNDEPKVLQTLQPYHA